jgi:hypothetical protein
MMAAGFAPVMSTVQAQVAPGVTIQIDDSTDGLTLSFNGTDLTTLLVNGVPPGTTVGNIDITGGLILTGPGCNAGPGNTECASVTWFDPSITNLTLPIGGSAIGPAVTISEASSIPGTPPVISDHATFTVSQSTDVGTSFALNFVSDSESSPTLDCTTLITGCTSLGLETGDFQNFGPALTTPVTDCIICALPALPAGYLTANIRSDIETTTVPEPTTLALLGLGLAGFGFSRRTRRQ